MAINDGSTPDFPLAKRRLPVQASGHYRPPDIVQILYRPPVVNPLARKMPPVAAGGPSGIPPAGSLPIATRLQDWPLPRPPRQPADDYTQTGFRPSPDPFKQQPTWLQELAKPPKPAAQGYTRTSFQPSPDPFKQQPVWTQGLANPGRPVAKGYTQSFPPAAAGTPFPQYDWPLAAKPRLPQSARSYRPPDIVTTTSNDPVQRSPVFNGIAKPRRSADDTISVPRPEPDAFTIALLDWPKPHKARPKATGEAAFPPPIPPMPYAQYDWPKPHRGRPKTGEHIQPTPATPQSPFAQYDWISATRARQKATEHLAYVPPLSIVPPVITPTPFPPGAGHPPKKRVPQIRLKSGKLYQPATYEEFRRLVAKIEYRTGQKPAMALPRTIPPLPQTDFARWSAAIEAQHQLLLEKQRLMLDEEEAALALLLLSME